MGLVLTLRACFTTCYPQKGARNLGAYSRYPGAILKGGGCVFVCFFNLLLTGA